MVNQDFSSTSNERQTNVSLAEDYDASHKLTQFSTATFGRSSKLHPELDRLLLLFYHYYHKSLCEKENILFRSPCRHTVLITDNRARKQERQLFLKKEMQHRKREQENGSFYGRALFSSIQSLIERANEFTLTVGFYLVFSSLVFLCGGILL